MWRGPREDDGSSGDDDKLNEIINKDSPFVLNRVNTYLVCI